MTKADKMNFENLIENAKRMMELEQQKSNQEEIKKIRQYCIDALIDYLDTCQTIVELFNKNNTLWNNPYIHFDERVGNGGYVSIGMKVHAFVYSKYCTGGETSQKVKGVVEIYKVTAGWYTDDFYEDLVTEGFTVDMLKNNNYTIESWVNIKKKADNTKKRSQCAIDAFRKDIQQKLDTSANNINNLVSASSEKYEKVKF